MKGYIYEVIYEGLMIGHGKRDLCYKVLMKMARVLKLLQEGLYAYSMAHHVLKSLEAGIPS